MRTSKRVFIASLRGCKMAWKKLSLVFFFSEKKIKIKKSVDLCFHLCLSVLFIMCNPTPLGLFFGHHSYRWVKHDPHGIYWTINAIDLKLCRLLDQKNKNLIKMEKWSLFYLRQHFLDSSDATLLENWIFAIFSSSVELISKKNLNFIIEDLQ